MGVVGEASAEVRCENLKGGVSFEAQSGAANLALSITNLNLNLSFSPSIIMLCI